MESGFTTLSVKAVKEVVSMGKRVSLELPRVEALGLYLPNELGYRSGGTRYRPLRPASFRIFRDSFFVDIVHEKDQTRFTQIMGSRSRSS